MRNFLAVGVLAAVFLSGCGYNDFQAKDEAVKAQWGEVVNQYQRRADLIPNLVKTVEGAANFERSTLEAIVNARASVGQAQAGPAITNDPQAFAKWQASQDALGSALSRLLVVVERYPDLKANQNFRDLQAQLEGTENRITVERMRFNEAAQAYNTARLRFPTNLFANMLGFGEKAYFKATAGAEKAPEVKFDFKPSPAPAH